MTTICREDFTPAKRRFRVMDGANVLAADMSAADKAHCRAIATYVFGADVANRATIEELQLKGATQP